MEIKNPPKDKLENLLKYYNVGQHDDAKNLALSITQEFPKHQFSWKVLGALFSQEGNDLEALNAKKIAVKLAPRDAEAYSNLGNTLKELGRLYDAEDVINQAIFLNPDLSSAHYNLGITHRDLNKLEESEISLKKAIELTPNYAKAHNALGNTLKDLGKLNESEASYKLSIEIKPDFAEPYHNLGVLLKELGRFDEAKFFFIRAIELKSQFFEAHQALASIKKFTSKDEHYLKMQELYFDPTVSEKGRCYINFGLAKACDDLEDFERAFTHYKEGNTFRKKLLRYNFNQDKKLFDQIKVNYSRIADYSFDLKKNKNQITPIFIIGMPRSGTTLVEQIISSHSQVTGAGELSYIADFGDSLARGLSKLNKESLSDFRNKYLIKVQNFSMNKKIITDKMPQNFYYIGLISFAFPEAKIIHVKRAPAAVCWSNYKQFFTAKNLGYSYDLNDIIKYYSLYQNLMSFWSKNLPNKIYDFDYEMLTINSENEVRGLIDYIGLNWEDKCLSPQDNQRIITTNSNIQIREKIYKGSSHQWKKYKPYLNEFFDNLDELIIQNS